MLAPPIFPTTTSYDEKGRVAAVIMNHRSDATTDSQTNLKFVFHYDSHGNRSECVYPSGVVKQWNYKYNSNDELTSMTETQVGAAGAPASWKTTTYDPTTGLSSALIDAVGNTIASQYDSDSVLKKKIYTSAAAPSEPAYNVNYSYDSDSGQLKEVKTYAGAGATQKVYGEAREYDAETGGLAKVSKESGGSGIGALNYAYNNTGALASISWLGRSVAYDYDEFGRLKTARANEADWEYTYAPCGKKATVHNTRANELETREYDGLGRLKSIEHKNANDNRIIFRIEYRLGPDGNRVGAFERRQTADDDIATSWSYTYDPLGRLIRERRTINEHYGTDPNTFSEDRDVGYQYDRDSNRTEVVDHRDVTQSESYSYVANTQRLDRVTYYTGKYKQYSWTANGELAREDNYENSALTTSQVYTWGIGGTLVEVRFQGGDQDGCKVNYEYDSDNELIGRKVTLKNGTVTENERYLVDHQNPTGYSQRLAVLDSLTGSIRHEIFTDELAAETTVNSGSSNTQFPHADGVGSIRALTGKSAAEENLGTSAEKHFYDYTAFGSSLRGDRSLTNYAFTGQVLDIETKRQFHRARWLSMTAGQWISPDVIFDWPYFACSYLYSGSNPANIKDITGKMSLIEMVVTIAVRGCSFVRAIAVRIGLSLLLRATKLVYWISVNMARIEFWLTLTLIGLEFLDKACEDLLKNADQVELTGGNPRSGDPGSPGPWIENKVKANATHYEIIDNYTPDGHVTSIKSHGGRMDQVLKELQKEVRTLENKNVIQPSNTAPPGTLPITNIQSRSVLMCIPENHSQYLNNRYFLNSLRELQRSTRTVIRVVPLKGWRR